MIGSQSSVPVHADKHSQYAMPLPHEEEEGGGAGFTLLQLWLMVRAHLWLSAGIFLLMAAVAFLAIKSLPKSYEATTALIVNVDNTDPLAGRNQGVDLAFSFFPTQVELIYNSVVLRPVIERLKLQNNPRFTEGFNGDPKALIDVIVTKLRAALQVRQGAGSALLYISATAREPVLAADIANAIADEYLHQISQRTNAPAMALANRYSDQLSELKAKVDATQEKVANFRQRYGMADLTSGQGGDMEGSALADLQTKLLEAQNARRQLEGQQPMSDAVGRLNQLEGEMAQSRATLGSRHPRILQLQAEIDATRKGVSGNSAVQLSKAREMENKYQAALAAERSSLLGRRNLQDEGAKLLLEQQLAKDAYAKALGGLDQVKFASVGNYQDVTVVSKAEPPIKASKPNKLKLFAAALLASLGLALGGPFAYELLLNRRIRCRDDLEKHFRIEMLAQFGPMDPVRAA